MKQITEEEYNNLKEHSYMLGRIGCYVENFVKEEETVEVGVLRLLAEYYFMRSEEANELMEKAQQRSL